jgi:2-iminobutanoate/2-iminopropanoate deaminase
MDDKVNIERLDSSKTPKAIGPYSKATRVDIGNIYMIFCSGSIGVNPESGNLVSDDVADQTKQAMENIKNLLEENNSCIDNISKTTIFLEVLIF